MRLIAHRGASGYAPENTMAAFRLAMGMGARAMELDVHSSADGMLAVIHDDDLKRVGGLRRRVKDLSWSELAGVDVGSWFHKKFSGERIPRLEELFTLSAGDIELHVEIKAGSRRYLGIERQVTGMIADFKAWDWTVVSSFDHKALGVLRGLDKRARLGYLRGLSTMRAALAEIKELGAESLHMSMRQAGRLPVAAAQRQGLKVLVYTVNTPQDLIRLGRIGVDGIFTNFPDLAEPAPGKVKP